MLGRDAPDGQFGRSDLSSSFLPWCLPSPIRLQKTHRKEGNSSSHHRSEVEMPRVSRVCVRTCALLPRNAFPQTCFSTLPRVCFSLTWANPCDLCLCLTFDGLPCQIQMGGENTEKRRSCSQVYRSISCDITRSPEETLHVHLSFLGA